MRQKIFSISLILALALLANSAYAQRTTGEILGTVTDATKAVLPGVTVTITNADTGFTRTVITDDSGNYHARLLPVGRYVVSAELAGFKKEELTGIILQVDQVARIDLTLTVGEISEKVEVQAQVPLTKTDSADVGMVIENKQIQELPLRGENSFVDMVSLDAGAAKPSSFLNSIFTDLFGGIANAYGSPPDGSRFMVDGVDVKEVAYSRIDIRLSGNAVQEMKSQMIAHSAEFGQNSGLQVNMVTKSGTNAFHGSLFWDLRNSVLNARNFFDPPREQRKAEGKSEVPLYQFNLFGGSIGGPIIKDKTFFFFNYQGTRDRKSITRFVSVPPVAMRNGDFSSLSDKINDPVTGQPFTGNIIPQNRISPVAKNILFGTSDGQVKPLFPFPDRPGLFNNLLPTRLQTQDFDQYVIRVDHKLTEADTLYGRYIHDSQDRVLRFNRYLHELPNFTDIFSTPAQNARIGWTRVVSPAAVNEVKLGFNRMVQTLVDEEFGKPIPALLGINGTSKLFQYNPWVIISGFNRAGTLLNTPNNRTDNTYTLGDTFSYNVGSHAYGFGVELRKREQNGGAQPIPNGLFITIPRYTGYALADFVLGLPFIAITGREDGFGNYRQTDFGMYVKDTWKVHPKLTLDLGLRWEYFSPWSDTRDRLSQFDPALGKLVLLGSNPGPERWVLPYKLNLNDPLLSKTSWPDGSRITDRDLNNFAPRIGIAYRPFGGNKTVFRAAYGIYYTPFDSFYLQQLRTNRPFVNSLSFVNDFPPTITLANPFPEGSGIPSATANGLQRKWIDGYNQQWNVTVERALNRNLVLEVGYIGNKASHLRQPGNLNLPAPGEGSLASRRPFPQFSGMNWTQPSASSMYHGLRTNLRRRFADGFLGNVSYVWSKWLDCGGNNLFADLGDNLARNPYDCRAEKGRSVSDQRHRLVLNFVYEIPFGRGAGKGVVGEILGNWNISSIGNFSSGGSVDVSNPFDTANTGGGNRPDLVGDPNKGAPHTTTEWFNTKAFAPVARKFAYGNAGRNIIIGPDIRTIDFSLFKDWLLLREDIRFSFRADFFNITNRTNFDLPNSVAFTPGFGSMFNAGTSRQVQLGLRIEF